ncbi:MAG: membrane-bound PQQ-dependent dehydrogenase, glucose/quinate/shikimate family [Burkholderiaceae bacterium]|nr:membrane-bound PQQ-dependent dehydrogenase, glucose/quinate/shikimate family [Burkholderiaceae bacterium]
MATTRPSGWLALAAVVVALMGLYLLGAGAWLVALGGSWYYAVAGAALLLVAGLLWRRRRAALWLYAAVVLGTLAWALWESGLDWWPLAARGDVVFVVGLLLISAWVARGLDVDDTADRSQTAGDDQRDLDRPPDAQRGPHNAQRHRRWWPARAALAASLALFLVTGIVSWFSHPHRIDGTIARDAANGASRPLSEVPKEDWRAYGRTRAGRRYSPLAQITPQNVSQLTVAWRFETGDLRGQKGDPPETTFEVTPLKIGERLFLCTPHQHVIALDATTGEKIWEYDPKIRGALALQHLTCRGLSYDDGRAAPPPGVERDAAAVRRSSKADLPVAAVDGPTVARCGAKLYMPTADGRIIAIDPDTGSVCKAFGDGSGQIDLWANMPNVNPGGYYSTSPVVVAHGLIIVGGTVLDNVSTHETSGVIRAYDADGGALVWNFDPGNPDETAPIAPDATYTPNSPNSWSIASVDPQLGLVYLPMGNAPPDQYGAKRGPAEERFSSSVVALELDTGKLRWVFQTVHHDLWDYDVPAQPSLVDLRIDGQTVPALVQPTKQGDLYVLDRRSGKPLLPVAEKPAPQGAALDDRTAPTQPSSALSFAPKPLEGRDMWGATMFDQLACRIAFHRLRYDGRFTPPSRQGTLVYPGNFGVFNWGGVAVDPVREVAFTTPAYLAFVSKLVPRANDRELYVQPDGSAPPGSLPALNENFGAPFAVKLEPFVSPLGIPCQAPPWGYVAAADLRTGEIVWRHRNGTVRDRAPIPLPFRMGVPDLGGPIVTASGVAFLSGTLDYYVRGYDVTTGEQLWRARLPAGGQATPMTYLGKDGRQYLVVVAGGHGSLGTKAGDSVIAYALPSG